jgi:UDP-glucuronate decarboxylase
MRQSNQNMKRILVTGAAGNIGSALTAALCRKSKYFIVAVDNLSTGSLVKLPNPKPENFLFIKSDVNNFQEISTIFLNYKFDYVFHFAAVVGVQRTLANPLLVLNDVEGFKNVLSLSKNCGVRRVFYSSSSEVYGEPVSLPQNEETTPLNSRLPYAIVKNIGEAYFKSYFAEHGLQYTIFRFFNTYGPNQSEDFVIPRFIEAAQRSDPITVYGDGSQTRTFCYVDDNIETVMRCMEEYLFINDALNVGSDIEISILELARLIIRLTRSGSEILHLPSLKEGDMTRRNPDITKMRGVLKRKLLTVEEGIKLMLKNTAVGNTAKQ